MERNMYAESPPEPQEQSVLGIISTAISVLTSLVLCGLMVAFFAAIGALMDQMSRVGVSALDNVPDEFGALGLITIICTLGAPLIGLVGLVLGIIGLTQQDRKKLFSILGVVFSSLLLIASCGIVIFFLISLAATGSSY